MTELSTLTFAVVELAGNQIVTAGVSSVVLG